MKPRRLIYGRPGWWAVVLVLILGIGLSAGANLEPMPFAPGERLEYELRWEFVPAGKARLEVLPFQTFEGQKVYHFVLTARSNRAVDFFFKVRDRIDAYADVEMTRSIHYKKNQREGRHRRKEVVKFDWNKNLAFYTNFGRPRPPLKLMPGSFDVLSAFYFTRMVNTEIGSSVQHPITDGKKNVMGRLKVVGRETITLRNGRTYETFRVEPELKHVGGVFKKSKGARIHIWVTADHRRIPVRLTSKVIVGRFIGELTDMQTLQ